MIFEEVVNLEFIQKVWMKMKNHDWWIKWSSHFWIAPLSFVNPFPKSLIPSLTWWKLQGFGNVRGMLFESTVHFLGLPSKSIEIEIQMSARSEDSWDNILQSLTPCVELVAAQDTPPLKRQAIAVWCDQKIVHDAVSGSWCTTLKGCFMYEGMIYVYIYIHIHLFVCVCVFFTDRLETYVMYSTGYVLIYNVFMVTDMDKW